MCVAVAANVLLLRAPVLATYVRASPSSLLVPLPFPCWGKPQTPKAV